MPLVAKACLAYALGLFAVCVTPSPLAAATLAVLSGLGVIAIALPALEIRRDAALCAILLGAGGVVGSAAVRHADVCAKVMAHAGPLHAEIENDAEPGALVHGRTSYGDCESSTTILVARGHADGGDEVIVRGDVSAGARGLMIRDATLTGAYPPPSLGALRARVGRRIDRIFGSDSALVRALVIADMSAIPAEQRDRFARAGLVHMLSVSGLHVAIVVLAFALLASALRVPRVPAHVATLVLLASYVLLIGAPPPAVRAAVMLALVIGSKLLQRPTSRWAIVAVGSAVPLAEPTVVMDLGWQLSVAGTIALVAGAALARRILPRRWRGFRRSLASAATISVVATIATAPLVAWTFGRLAILSPLTNLLADPLMGILQPVLFLALCIPIQPLERVMADAAHVLILGFDGIATHAAALPFAAPVVLPSGPAALASGVAAVAIIVACLSREMIRPIIIAVAAVSVMIVEPFLHLPRDRTELHMIDVGQGDALALRTRAGRWVVIDAGRTWRGGDAGRSTVVPYLAHRGGEVALFILSHPHADHVGGAASLLDALTPGAFLDPGYVGTTPPYLAALVAARRDNVPWHRVRPGDSVVVDEMVITTLAPDSAWAAALADANLASTVASIRVGRLRFLFTGDAEGPEEDWLLAHAPDALAADVLKVGHHGSSTSTTPAFLAAVHPRVALVSVGDHNSYGHPSRDVMAALESSGAQVLRTDQLGTVILRTDGEALEVEARGARWNVPARPRR